MAEVPEEAVSLEEAGIDEKLQLELFIIFVSLLCLVRLESIQKTINVLNDDNECVNFKVPAHLAQRDGWNQTNTFNK